MTGPTSTSEVRSATARATGAGAFRDDERSAESLAMGMGAVAFVVAALVALAVFQLGDAPIAGDGSLGEFAAIASAVTAMLAFAAGRFLLQSRPDAARIGILGILDAAALAFAHGIIALLTLTLLADILEQGFIGATVYPLPLLVLAGAAAAVTAYVAFLSSMHMDLSTLSLVLAVFLVEGVIASALTASDPQWWVENLSALGITNDLSSMAFNLTLIVAGFLVTTLARAATLDIPTPRRHGARNVRIGLILVGIFLACVGIFPVNDFFWLHNSVATGMAVVFAVVVLAVPRWIPGLTRGFFLVGWTFLAVIVVCAVFFATGYYTLTAVELVAGVLVFSWIILFIRNAAALHRDTV